MSTESLFLKTMKDISRRYVEISRDILGMSGVGRNGSWFGGVALLLSCRVDSSIRDTSVSTTSVSTTSVSMRRRLDHQLRNVEDGSA